jgi:hypothetical protein
MNKTNYKTETGHGSRERCQVLDQGAVGAGNNVAAPFNALPQLAAEGEGSTSAQQRQGGGGVRGWEREWLEAKK